jgi:transcriptional regulator with XRE-family HTH domain
MSNSDMNDIKTREAGGMPQTQINVPALYAALDAVRENRNMSWRQLAREVEVSPSTFSRMANRQKPDVDAFLALVRWLRVPAERFMRDGDIHEREEPPLMAELAPLLRARRDLNTEDKKYLEEIIGAAVRRFAADPSREDQ